jgi:hypothetical protein
MCRDAPNTSAYPEIDIAAKVAAESNIDRSQISPLAKLLSPLSNAGSWEIRKRLQRQNFVLYYPSIPGPLVLALERRGFPLTRARSSRAFIE